MSSSIRTSINLSGTKKRCPKGYIRNPKNKTRCNVKIDRIKKPKSTLEYSPAMIKKSSKIINLFYAFLDKPQPRTLTIENKKKLAIMSYLFLERYFDAVSDDNYLHMEDPEIERILNNLQEENNRLLLEDADTYYHILDQTPFKQLTSAPIKFNTKTSKRYNRKMGRHTAL